MQQTGNSSDKNFTAPEKGEELIVIQVKDYGTIKIKVFSDLLPEACENFVTHAKDGYYDELLFHREIENFMIHGGDPKGKGPVGKASGAANLTVVSILR